MKTTVLKTSIYIHSPKTVKKKDESSYILVYSICVFFLPKHHIHRSLVITNESNNIEGEL